MGFFIGADDVNATLDVWYQAAAWLMLLTAVPVFITLAAGTPVAYGRYSRSGWGVLMNARVAWLTQELPSLLVIIYIFSTFGNRSLLEHPFSSRTVLVTAFCVHYAYRSLIFPLLLRGGKPTPLSIWAFSFIFCIWNGFIQGWSFARHMPDDIPIWTPRIAAGLALWLYGWLNVMRADVILIHLRKKGETGYKIPRGGMFEYVSAGNYASEILEWTGFALAAGNLPAFAFALFAFCNLAPRGHHHHRWYREKFKDEYPKGRKAVVPFIW